MRNKMTGPKWEDTEALVETPKWDDTEELSDQENSESSISKLESFGRGAAQGATFGFADELAGLTKAATGEDYGALDPITLSKLLLKAGKGAYEVATTDKTLSDLAEDYKQEYVKERDESRKAFEAAREANPLSYGAGELGGGVASSLLIPGGAAVQGAKGLAKVGQIAKQGALIGGLYSSGASEADLTKGELGEFGKDVAIGAGSGALTNVVLPTVLSKALGEAKGVVGPRQAGLAGLLESEAADQAKRYLYSAGTGAAAGMAADLAAGGETDLAESALTGAGIGIGARGLTRGALSLGGLLANTATKPITREKAAAAFKGGELRKPLLDPEVKQAEEVILRNNTKAFADELASASKKAKDVVDDITQVIKEEQLTAKQGSEDTLMGFVNKLYNTLDEVSDDISNSFDIIAEQTADVKFKPTAVTNRLAKVADPLSKEYNPSAFSGDAWQSKMKNIIEFFNSPTFSGQVGLDEVKVIKNQLYNLATEARASGNNAAASEFFKAYGDLNSHVAEILKANGKDTLAQALSTANSRWSNILKLTDRIGSNVESQIRNLRKLGETQEAGKRFFADEIRKLASEAEGPSRNLTKSLEDVAKTARLSKEAKPLTVARLEEEAVNRLSQDQRLKLDAVKKLKDYGFDYNEFLTSPPEAKFNTIDRLMNTLEQEAFPSTASKANVEAVTEAVDTLLGPGAFNKFIEANKQRAGFTSLTKQVGRETGGIGPSLSSQQFAREATGMGTEGLYRIANWLGRLKSGNIGSFTKDIIKDDKSISLISNKLREKGGNTSSRLADILDRILSRDMAGRSALMYTIMQNPEYRKELSDLNVNEE